MSMYGDYIRERLGDGIIEREEGFSTYRFLPDSRVYIVDIYVRPDFRRTDVAADMADEICAIAKEKGHTKVVGSVQPSAKGSTDSLKVLLSYGMRLVSSGNDAIIFEKEI